MNEISCPHCGKKIELSDALTKDIEKTFLESENKKHIEEIERVKIEATENAQKQISAEKQKAQEDATSRVALKLEQIQNESDEEKKENKELRTQILALTTELRASRKTAENAELKMQKKLDVESIKIREDVDKLADEKQRLKLAEKDK